MSGRVLLIGTSFSAAPLAHRLKALGHEVAVCGALPHDPCVGWADAWFPIDYSDPQALLDLVAAERFAALCPTCNDYSYLAAAAAAERFGLPGFDGPEATRILHDKAAFRAFALAHRFPVPRAWSVAPGAPALPPDLPYPLLVKPTDNSGGRGLSRVDRPDALAAALERARGASRGGAVVVEEWVEGTLHSHSAFLRGQRVAAEFFVDEFCTVYPYQVDSSNAPSRLGAGPRRRMRECIDELAQALNLTDGLLHTQFLVRGDEPVLVECMRRCPGDLYYQLVTLSSGAAYLDDYLRPFLGAPLQALPSGPEVPWARHTISLERAAVVWSFGHRIPAAEVRIVPLREGGSLIGPAPGDKVALLFARFDDPATLFRVTPGLRDLILLDATEGHHARP